MLDYLAKVKSFKVITVINSHDCSLKLDFCIANFLGVFEEKGGNVLSWNNLNKVANVVKV